jgi:hypothetical protein
MWPVDSWYTGGTMLKKTFRGNINYENKTRLLTILMKIILLDSETYGFCTKATKIQIFKLCQLDYKGATKNCYPEYGWGH